MAERIEYIDSAKGLCMLLIVASHVGVPEPWTGAYVVRVLLFFLLSGYFFSASSTPGVFFKKKARTLLVPFLIFWIISYALFYVGSHFVAGFADMTKAQGILDCFTQKEYFNGPLWFILALFFVQVISYLIEHCLSNILLKVCLYLSGGVGGYLLGRYNIFLPLEIDIALTSLPFFCAGIMMRRFRMMDNANNTVSIVAGMIILCIVYLMNPLDIDMAQNRCENSFADYIMMGIILCVDYLLIFKLIDYKHNIFSRSLAFVGVNSMYIMCVHHLIYRPVKLIVGKVDMPYSYLVVFIVTVAICLVTAPIVNRYCPVVIGKKPSK